MRDDWSWKSTSPARAKKKARRSQKQYEDLPWTPISKRHRLIRGRGSSGTKEEGTTKDMVAKIIRETSYKCAFCKGMGNRPPGSVCPVCKGRGENKIKPPVVKCAFCKGRGEAQPRSMLTCPTCKGKGVASVREPIEVCPECNGSGHVSAGSDSLYCKRCKGKGVVEGGTKRKRFLPTPAGTERQVAVAIFQLEGEASVAEIAPKLRISTTYVEYVCKSMLNKGYLEKVGRTVYVLTPECESIVKKREISELQKLTPEQRNILKTIKDNGESPIMEIAKKISGKDIGYVRRVCNKLAERDFIDMLLSGKVAITPKGEKAFKGEKASEGETAGEKALYALTPDYGRVVEQSEISDLQKLSSGQREILKTIRDKGESTLEGIAQRIAGGDVDYVKGICDSLVKGDFVDVLLSGKVTITPKGENAFRD